MGTTLQRGRSAMPPGRRRVAPRLLLALVSTAVLGAAPPAVGRDVETDENRLAREATASSRFQTEFPEPAEEPERRARFSPALGGIATLLLYAVAVALVLLVALWIVAEIRRRARLGDGDGRGTTHPVVDRTAASATGGSAGRLAEQGRFAEAMHALLLQALGELARRAGLRANPALTSRELAARLRLAGRSRTALDTLLRDVERAHFGGVPVGDGDYASSVDRFRTAVGREPL